MMADPIHQAELQRFSRGGAQPAAPAAPPPVSRVFTPPPAAATFQWSTYQQAIFDDVSAGTNSLVIVARAGAAKTSSILEAARRLDRGRNRCLFLAFNKRIEQELADKSPSGVMVKTAHAFGLWQYMRNAATFHGVDTKDPKRQYQGRFSAVDKTKARQIAEEAVASVLGVSKADKALYYGARKRVGDLFDKCREQLVGIEDEQAATDLCTRFAINENTDPAPLARAALWCMRESARQAHRLDFTDMLWFPHHFNYGVAEGSVIDRYDVVFVDECQDLDPAQVSLVARVLKPGGRVIAVGDEKQAIYLWRGADGKALDRMAEQYGAKRLTLPISYRCPRLVVELAQTRVPDIQVAPGAKDGLVENDVPYSRLLDDAQPGDFILSRTNAPLARTCLRFIRRGRPACIAGTDVGQQLKSLLEQSKARSVDALEGWLEKFVDREKERYGKTNPRRVEGQADKADTLLYIVREAGSLTAAERQLDTLFSDDSPTSKIVCSTVHKAKGLERDRIWLLTGSFLFNILRGKLAKVMQDGGDPTLLREQLGEENNIWYVGVTRAKSELRLVTTSVKAIYEGAWDTTEEDRDARSFLADVLGPDAEGPGSSDGRAAHS